MRFKHIYVCVSWERSKPIWSQIDWNWFKLSYERGLCRNRLIHTFLANLFGVKYKH